MRLPYRSAGSFTGTETSDSAVPTIPSGSSAYTSPSRYTGPAGSTAMPPFDASQQPVEAPRFQNHDESPRPQHDDDGEPSSSNGVSNSRVVHRRGPWSEQEDAALMRRVREIGAQDWGRVTKAVGSRSPKQCRERYFQNLRPDLNHEPINPEEGVIINDMVASHGKKWADIARMLKGRSDNAVKNWWNGNQNRKRRKDKETARVAEAQHQAQAGPSSYASHVGPSSHIPQVRRSTYAAHAAPSNYAAHAGPSSHAQSRPPLYHPLPAQAPAQAAAPAPIHAPSYQAYRHTSQNHQGFHSVEALPSPATSDSTDRGHSHYSLSPGYHYASTQQPPAQLQPQTSPRTALPHTQPRVHAGPTTSQYQLPPLEQHSDDRAPRISTTLLMSRHGHESYDAVARSPVQQPESVVRSGHQSPAQLPTAPASPPGFGRPEESTADVPCRAAPTARDDRDPRLSVRNLLQ